ncbi:MAG: hypothetical protein R3Y26_04215 [Rikenellaceae bacterium]
MDNLLLKLEKYFSETPQEQITKDWEKTVHFDNDYGVKAYDFLNVESDFVYTEIKEQGISSEFSSSFIY